MAYNNGFPMSYQQFYQPQYQQPYNSFQSGNNQMQQQASPQMMTPPTIHAEIVQIADRNEAVNFPVGTTPVYGNQPIFTCGGNNCGCGGNF